MTALFNSKNWRSCVWNQLPFALESQLDQHISTSSIEKAVTEKLDQYQYLEVLLDEDLDGLHV